MQDVVIVGVGGLGRECGQWCEDINADERVFNVLGFLDDDASKHGSTIHDLPVLGGSTWMSAHAGTVAASGLQKQTSGCADAVGLFNIFGGHSGREFLMGAVTGLLKGDGSGRVQR